MRFSLYISYCLSLVCWSCAYAIPQDTAPIAHVSFQTATGNTATLKDFQGSTVVLHFMASWCGECILEAPSLNTLARTTAHQGIRVVGIAIDDHALSAKALISRLQIPYPLLLDSRKQLKKFFEIRGVPVTYMLGNDGRILTFTDPDSGKQTYRVNGPRTWDSPAALRAVRQAALSHARTQPISNRR